MRLLLLHYRQVYAGGDLFMEKAKNWLTRRSYEVDDRVEWKTSNRVLLLSQNASTRSFIHGRKLPGSSKRPLAAAVQIRARAGLQDAAVSVVEPDATDHAAIGSPTALKPAVDDVGDHAVAGLPSSGDVCGGWPPCSGDDVVGRRLGRLRGHPEPERRLEGYDCVGRNKVRIGEKSLAYCSPGWPVVVVAEKWRPR